MNETLLPLGYTEVAPDHQAIGVYWVAVRGHALAVIPPNAGQSCIASVEEHFCEACQARGWAWGDVYVIWQPKDPRSSVWARWQKKWSARTMPETAQAA